VKLTPKQTEANKLLAGDATNCMLFGGSRSGKTFLCVRAIIIRAINAPFSRHCIFRFRFNAVKASVGMDTLPKVFKLCFPDIEYTLDKTDWRFTLTNGSSIILGGLDDKERTEKILGQEFASIYFNECSEIGKSARDTAMTRLAQCCGRTDGGQLKLKAYYDCNPPSKAHWSYSVFLLRQEPTTKKPLDATDYVSMLINPADNVDNLPAGYIDKQLKSLPTRKRNRYLSGIWADATQNALWTDEIIDRWRESGELPDLQRIVVGVDPSGASESDASEHDAIGIVVGGLGVDGNCYILEDVTVSGGPATWGKVAVSAFERHDADAIIGESNYGGAMVEHVIQTSSDKRISYKSVTATRGKVVRAEPISALYEQGKVRHAGVFGSLEEELCAFSTSGYTGEDSPNRADALVWVVTELFPGIVKPRKQRKKHQGRPRRANHSTAWMG